MLVSFSDPPFLFWLRLRAPATTHALVLAAGERLLGGAGGLATVAASTSAAAATVSLAFPHSPSLLMTVGEGRIWRVLLLCTFGFVD